MVKALLINFGRVIYEGESLFDAMEAVEAAGFEANVLVDKTIPENNDLYFSPIGGWKHI